MSLLFRLGEPGESGSLIFCDAHSIHQHVAIKGLRLRHVSFRGRTNVGGALFRCTRKAFRQFIGAHGVEAVDVEFGHGFPLCHYARLADDKAGISHDCNQYLKFNVANTVRPGAMPARSEEHTSELQSLMRISYAVFCLKKKKTSKNNT